MAFVKDERNAQTAYHFSIRRLDDKYTDFGGIYCSGCIRQITVKMGLHVCTQCADVDLCDRCMADYAINVLVLATCSGHAFFDVDTANLESVEPTALPSKAAVDAWIDEISDQYNVESVE